MMPRPTIYYNDNCPQVCEWIRQLMFDGLVPFGVVDSRSILDVQPADLEGFTQCHFFCGIAGWPYALKLAGWPSTRPVWTGSPPCFTAGTLVTSQRGNIAIEDIQVGDVVMTHTGQWHSVLKTGSDIKPVGVLVGQGHSGIICTPEHPFYARERAIISTKKNGKSIRSHHISSPEWTNAEDMPGSWWGMPMNYDIAPMLPPEGISSVNAFWLAGFYTGDGWTGKGRNSGTTIFGVNAEKADRIVSVLRKEGLSFSVSNQRTGVRVEVRHAGLSCWLSREFGCGSGKKRVPLKLIAAQNETKLSFMEGWMLSDGTRKKMSGSQRVTTISRDLAVTGRMLLVSLGYSVAMRKIETSDQTVIEGRTVNQSDYYTLSFSENTRYLFRSEGHTFFKVKSFTPLAAPRRVYNIEVDCDNSYLADGIVVHNCQPFSAAGKLEGKDDARHLAPHFISLVGACRPPVLFGEQVASAAVFGKSAKRVGGEPEWAWLDDLSDRLEASRYAVGASDIPAAGVGAPHIRQRTFFGAVRLADASVRGCEPRERNSGICVSDNGAGATAVQSGAQSASERLADANGRDACAEREQRSGQQRLKPQDGGPERLAEPWGVRRQWGQGAAHRGVDDGQDAGRIEGDNGTARDCQAGPERLADAERGERGSNGLQGFRQADGAESCGASDKPARDCDGSGLADAGGRGSEAGVSEQIERQEGQPGKHDDSGNQCAGRQASPDTARSGTDHGGWDDVDWLFCRDGKWRPVKSSVQRLADGLPGSVVPCCDFVPASSPLAQSTKASRRVMRLRGYGNAIVPQAAALFIRAFDAVLTQPSINGNSNAKESDR